MQKNNINWFDRYCLASLWDNDGDEHDPESVLAAIYELEYKYNAIKNWPFKGHPKRKENIFAKVKEELQENGALLKNMLINTYSQWLSSHAITDPEQWSLARTSEAISLWEDENRYKELNPLLAISSEYTNRINNDSYVPPETYLRMIDSNLEMMIEKGLQSPENFPNLVSFFKKVFVPDRKELFREYVSSDGWEDFAYHHGIENASEDKVEKWIDSYEENFINELDTFDFDLNYFVGSNGLASAMEEWGLLEGVCLELNKNFVFPAWYDVFGSQGIGETRDRVEQTFENLKESNPENIENFIPALNLALHEAHHSGQMLDYFEGGNLDSVLTEYSQDKSWYVPINEELEQNGFEVPEALRA